MANEFIEIGSIKINLADIFSVWVDQSATAGNTEASSQNHYIGGAFFLLVAGLVNSFLRKNADKRKGAQYSLNIVTNSGTSYKFESNCIDIPAVLQELALRSRLGLLGR
jgi:hypothetical protein